MNSKKLLLILIITSLATTVTAQTNATATPGTETVLSENTSVNGTAPSQVVSSELPGDLNLTVSSNGSLVANPGFDLFPGNYTGVVELDNGFNESYRVEIPRVFNWTTQPSKLNGTISVGSSGSINQTKIQLESNIDPNFNSEITGNISEYFSFNRFQFEGDGEYTAILGYGVNENTAFGNYTGNFTINGNENTSQTINLSYRFKDETPPEIQNLESPDLMATEQPVISAQVTDNLNVSKVNGTIFKKNSTSGEFEQYRTNISFSKKSNTENWTYQLQETSNESEYEIRINAYDESGNSDNQTSTYNISRLDVIEILNDNFRFDSIWPNDEKTQKILETSKEISASIELTFFDKPSESDLTLGILRPGDEQPIKIDEGEEVDITEAGQYSLVVETSSESKFNSTRDYDGEIRINRPKEHINLSTIVFGGEIESDQYPKPRSLGVGQFRGRLTYLESANKSGISELFSEIDNENRSLAVYIGALPRENCQGSLNWTLRSCTGFDLGEMERVEAENQRVKQENQNIKDGELYHYVAVALVLLFGTGLNYAGFVAKNYQRKNLLYPVWRTRKQRK